MSRVALLGVLLALAAALAGCGSGDGAGSVAPLAGGATGAQASKGRALFADHCASCHALDDADADGSVGPDLDEHSPQAGRVAAKIQAGGGGMPSFTGQLSSEEIALLAAYVGAVAGR